MEYNRSDIMKEAWRSFRMFKRFVNPLSFSECLKRAWAAAKKVAKEAKEIAEKGIVRMHYSEYKNNYSNCETVAGSYNAVSKTIEVMTKVVKAVKMTAKKFDNTGRCFRCGGWCYGDCRL